MDAFVMSAVCETERGKTWNFGGFLTRAETNDAHSLHVEISDYENTVLSHSSTFVSDVPVIGGHGYARLMSTHDF